MTKDNDITQHRYLMANIKYIIQFPIIMERGDIVGLNELMKYSDKRNLDITYVGMWKGTYKHDSGVSEPTSGIIGDVVIIDIKPSSS